MPPSPRPTVVLWSAPDTLRGVDARLRRAGVQLVRLHSMKTRPVPPRTWLEKVARAPLLDTVVVTSRTAVGAGIRPWRQAVGRLPRGLEVWAVGPGTAAALRRAGMRRVHRSPAVGAAPIVRSLAYGPRRNIAYFRSDRAGRGLARALRKEGHQVVDLVVYCLGAAPRLTLRARRDLEAADLLVVTSPSGLSELRRQLGGRGFVRLGRTARLVVLGERSRRSALRHGFRRVSVAPSTAPYRFSRHLLRELDNART